MTSDLDMWNPEEYSGLTVEKFDAVITGELTHQALNCENELIAIITEHFCRKGAAGDFSRLLLYRDGLTFQDKIEIVRAMLPLLVPDSTASNLKTALRKVEDLKALRNAFAHGFASSPLAEGKLSITVEVVGRSGAEKWITVTPETHCQTMREADDLVDEFRIIRTELITAQIAATLSNQALTSAGGADQK
jgi:hypothetical protein